jgi:hypothetical protein
MLFVSSSKLEERKLYRLCSHLTAIGDGAYNCLKAKQYVMRHKGETDEG